MAPALPTPATTAPTPPPPVVRQPRGRPTNAPQAAAGRYARAGGAPWRRPAHPLPPAWARHGALHERWVGARGMAGLTKIFTHMQPDPRGAWAGGLNRAWRAIHAELSNKSMGLGRTSWKGGRRHVFLCAGRWRFCLFLVPARRGRVDGKVRRVVLRGARLFKGDWRSRVYRAWSQSSATNGGAMVDAAVTVQATAGRWRPGYRRRGGRYGGDGLRSG